MAREIFEVTKDRFHLQDPCCYILQGTWPKEAKMRACLDGSEVKSEIKKLEMVSALERFKDPDLMRGERITAEIRLPESLEGFQKLSVYADMPDKNFCWFSVPVKELERRRGKPQFFIEEEKVQQGFLRVRGWAVASEPVKIQIFDENKEKISAEILRTERVDVEQLYEEVAPVIFDPKVMPKRVNQAAGEDLVLTSACNYYDGVTQQEAEDFYGAMKDPKDETPVSYGLNSRLVKEDGKIREKVWKVGGLYGQALEKIVYWLKKAEGVAENPEQKAVIAKLVEFYETGDLKTFDDYAVLWVKDLDSRIDFVNGFTESYGDPLGMKASWESLVNFKDLEATRRTEIISSNAQWFEDHSPVEKQFKKEEVKGVSAKVITAAILAGDLYPSTAIGINLPNANWIRSHHGSKSVTIGNITDAYNKAAHGNGFNEEFVYSDAELKLIDQYADITDNLHTDLHECLGHGSGKLLPGVDPDALKAYGSTIEEARADLFGLYYVADPKLVELGLTPSEDAYKAQFYTYLMNGLMTQLVRIEPGNNVEEAHMRNRQLIARWVYEKGAADKVVELVKKDGKTYVVINDYAKVRELFGELLAEIQRIKSTGDYDAARKLVEAYAVKVDPELHAEVLERYKKLNLAPYKGFVNPKYEAVTDADGNITDITVTYDEGYAEQMLRYSKDYSVLPSVNN